MPWTTLVAGTPITAAWANANVRDQAVSMFTNAAARTVAMPSPVAGTLSYLTASQALEIYTTTTTGWRKPWNMPWGRLYYVPIPAATAIATGVGGTETVARATASITIPSNRKIQVAGFFQLRGSGPFIGEISLRRTNATGTLLVGPAEQTVIDAIGNARAMFRIDFEDTGYTTGANVWAMTGRNADIWGPAAIWVDDVGPNGGPV